MGIFNNHEKKVLTELCKKSEDIGNDITNEINELLEDLKTEYEANKVILKEFNTFVSSMENKLNAEELEQLFGKVKQGRYNALALTALEQSIMWIIKELTA